MFEEWKNIIQQDCILLLFSYHSFLKLVMGREIERPQDGKGLGQDFDQ